MQNVFLISVFAGLLLLIAALMMLGLGVGLGLGAATMPLAHAQPREDLGAPEPGLDDGAAPAKPRLTAPKPVHDLRAEAPANDDGRHLTVSFAREGDVAEVATVILRRPHTDEAVPAQAPIEPLDKVAVEQERGGWTVAALLEAGETSFTDTVVADGASVAYSAQEENAGQLHNKLVVVWIEGQPMVRWFQHCGRYALLRAENPDTVPPQALVDLEDDDHPPRFRRILWINTPH